MTYQTISSTGEFLSGLLYILSFVGVLGVLTVLWFLLLTYPIWIKELVKCRKQGLRGWELIKCVFG